MTGKILILSFLLCSKMCSSISCINNDKYVEVRKL